MIILAPMAGATDSAFRILAKRFGCDLVVSEMVSAQGLIYQNQRTEQLLGRTELERPYAVQLFGHEPDALSKAALYVEQHYAPEYIDLNMGCPTPKVVKNGDGAALMRNPKLVGKIVSSVVEAVRTPVTVKIRLGWDQDTLNFLDIGKIVADSGAHWIALHARTREQFYAGTATWEHIASLKETVKIPVVGNGDVNNALAAKRMLHETGCDHVMIGRAALGNPWIFEQVKWYLASGTFLEPPSLAERIAVALEHLQLKISEQDELQAVREMRSQLAWYLKGVPHSSTVRSAMNKTTSYEEASQLLSKLIKPK